MNIPKLNPYMLKIARELKEISQAELAEQLNVSPPYINRLEHESMAVSTDLIKELIKKLDKPQSFFFQEGEIIPSYLNYRRREKVSAKDLSRIEATINLYRLGVEKVLINPSYKVPKIPVLPVTKSRTPQQCANELREQWKIKKGEIKNLSNILEAHNVLHVCFDFGTERVDGKSIITTDHRPIIFTNRKILGDRQRFTLAHQLGHLVMHTKIEDSFDKDINHNANLFAAELLMPEEEIKKDFAEGITIPILALLKKKWKVSMISMVYRAHDLEIITDNQKRYLEQQFNQLQIRRREPLELDIPREEPALLKNLISEYKQKQKFSMKQLADYFHLKEEEFTQRYN
jgi:Zn-dependent peptidase ImmA (M78 family)/DNA-binding XRE family transcriptional regulator